MVYYLSEGVFTDYDLYYSTKEEFSSFPTVNPAIVGRSFFELCAGLFSTVWDSPKEPLKIHSSLYKTAKDI